MSGKPKFAVQPGDRFGRGVVLSETRTRDHRGHVVRWVKLLCDCRTIYDVRIADLFKAVRPTRSCGCLMRETASITMRRQENLDRLAAYARSPEGRANTVAANKASKTKHGLARHDGVQHPLYSTWADMMSRCYNPKVRSYRDYGARGIAVCERWHDPQLFIEDIEASIGPRPPGMTLDRTDNDSDYAPGKVRWATRAEQVRNSRRYIDGQRSGPVYQLWWRLMRQCPDSVCPAWHDFPQFSAGISVLGERPAGARVGRLDDAKPYGPGNVCWGRTGRPSRK